MEKFISLILAAIMVASTVISLFAFNVSADEEPQNVALNKEVMGSGSNPQSVTDGKRDNANNHWDGGVAPSEVIIDLGEYYDITKANVVTYYGDGRHYNYTVEASTDGLNFEVIGEKTDNKTATVDGTDFTFNATARYFKVKLTKNSANPSVHLVEVEVYGVPNTTFVPAPLDPIDPNDPDNIAYHKPTRSNSTSGFSIAVNDGNIETSWRGIDYPKYVDVDLLDNYDINKIIVNMPKTNKYLFDVYGSKDGVSYTKIASVDKLQPSRDSGFVFEFSEPIDYRIIRVNVTYNNAGISTPAEIAEIRVYGTKNSTQVTPTRETIQLDSYEKWLKDKHGIDLEALKDENGKYDIDKTYTEDDTVNELNGIVTRLLGEKYISWFTFDVAPNPVRGNTNDYFKIEDSNGKIKISGTDGTCIAAGLNWYLKYYCNVHIAQQTKNVNMPESAPAVEKEVFMDTPMKVRYAYNYCTLSYSMAFFGYDDWRRELDWLMLNGINLVLDITATEALWVHYLQQLGYTVDQAKDYVCGYAYKAWWLMGNLENYGGSVSDQWVIDTLEMARVNQRSLTVMGAEPALQTFVGAMPSTFGKLAKPHLLEKGFDDVSKYMAPQGGWSGLTRPNVLRTDYDGYSYLAQLFYESQNYIYGQVTDYYCGDVCHEGGIIPEGLAKEDMASKILEECMTADKDAIWMLQVWWDNPMKGVLDGFGEYRTKNVMLIDLAAANNPKYTNSNTWGSAEYGGTPWIFSTLDNYGGRPGMHGKLKNMCDLIVTAKKNAKYLVGIGMTPEGTLQNPVMYDLYWEMTWRNETPELKGWINQYIERRYGELTNCTKAAWELIYKTIYTAGSADGTTINSIIGTIPKFDYTGGYYIPTYSTDTVLEALELLMEDFDKFSGNECYIYDVVDLSRMYLSNLETDYLTEMRELASRPKRGDNAENYLVLAKKYMSAMMLVDELSSYVKDELLGTWIGRVDVWVNDERTGKYDDYTVDTMKFNAKCLISAWCSYSLIDYANRHYSGLISDYYYKSWEEFFDNTNYDVAIGNAAGNAALPGKSHYTHAWNFINNGKEYTTVVSDPNGNETSRGLVAIFNKIKLNFNGVDFTDIIEFKVKEDSGFAINKGVITGIEAEHTLRDVINSFDVSKRYIITAIDKNGNELTKDSHLSNGTFIYLTDSNGTNLDTIVVNGIAASTPEPSVTPDATPGTTVTTPEDSTEPTDTSVVDIKDDDDDMTTIFIAIGSAIAAAAIAAAVVYFIMKKKK